MDGIDKKNVCFIYKYLFDDFHWKIVDEVAVNASKEDVSRALRIWIDKPHVVNRRLRGIKLYFDNYSDPWNLLEKDPSALIVPNEPSTNVEMSFIQIYLTEWKRQFGNEFTYVEVRKMLPRHSKYESTVECVLSDESLTRAIFIPLNMSLPLALIPNFVYSLSYENDVDQRIALRVYESSAESNVKDTASAKWLQTSLLPRLKKWSENKPVNSYGVDSLSLISAEEYSELYLELKAKHCPFLVQNWIEKTDPSKFVFEDIAIATYLLLLWKKERKDMSLEQKQTFVDLGCGNGLLVYILNAEGHKGVGLDVRERKIWKMFGSTVTLKVEPITPSPLTVYSEFDWLIGNHSDELTPWIPMFASRSSFNTRFFLLPCCCFDFKGKFQRLRSGESQYQSYLKYIHEVATQCGFDILQDKLRIPSTKRVCLIGMTRNYAETDEKAADDKRMAFLKVRCENVVASNDVSIAEHSNVDDKLTHTNVDDDDDKMDWLGHVPIRSSVEVVRNCSSLDKGLVQEMVTTVADALLKASDFSIQVVDAEGTSRTWRTGGKMEILQLVALFGKEKLAKMKNECGGLQTLLKNHGYIFRVVQGSVTLRNYADTTPYRAPAPKRRLKEKTKPCWFHFNHPDKCPLVSLSCKFLHDEIR